MSPRDDSRRLPAAGTFGVDPEGVDDQLGRHRPVGIVQGAMYTAFSRVDATNAVLSLGVAVAVEEKVGDTKSSPPV